MSIDDTVTFDDMISDPEIGPIRVMVETITGSEWMAVSLFPSRYATTRYVSSTGVTDINQRDTGTLPAILKRVSTIGPEMALRYLLSQGSLAGEIEALRRQVSQIKRDK